MGSSWLALCSLSLSLRARKSLEATVTMPRLMANLYIALFLSLSNVIHGSTSIRGTKYDAMVIALFVNGDDFGKIKRGIRSPCFVSGQDESSELVRF